MSFALLMVCRAFAAIGMLVVFAAIAAFAAGSVILKGNVVDEDGKPVPLLEVRIQSPEGRIHSLHTNAAGRFEYYGAEAGEYRLGFNKTGFFRLTDQPFVMREGDNEATFTVNHETEIHEEIEVYSSADSISSQVVSHSEALISREIRDIPVSTTHDLRSSLETLAEVVRDNSGQLHIAGGRAGETQYLLDGFDIGNPSTGDLNVRVNVDSVRVAEVESGRFGTQYGRAGAGVLSLDTTVGDDRWRAGATNFFPGVSAERGIHLTSWYPRFTLSGPLSKGRAWFSEALSIQHTLSLVDELPRNEDSVSQWAGDNMLRTQIRLTPKHILQGSFLYNQMRASNLGLGPFSPISTTRGMRAYRSFFSLKDQIWSGRTFYELGLAADFSHDEILPRGYEPYSLTPNGSSGNHFESLRQKTRRWQVIGSVSMPARKWKGTHDVHLGFNAAELIWKHSASRNPVEVRRIDNTLAQRTDYAGSGQFRLTDTIVGIFANDTWRVFTPLVLNFGLRVDWDRVFHSTTVSPRIAANLMPFKNNNAKFTVAWGEYLQPATLSILGPAYDQQRSDIFFDRAYPSVSMGPVLSRFILPGETLKQPRFYTTSIGWEQAVGSKDRFAANVTIRSGRFGLAYNKESGDVAENIFALRNNRKDCYRALLLSFRHSFSDKTEVSAHYTRSRTRTNQVYDYSLDTLVFNPQEAGPLGWDAPHRFVSSGWTPAPVWNLFLSYYFEYRTGFPFSVVNEQQQVVGSANRLRYPDYASLNLGIEKRLRLFRREWAVRISVLNSTSHPNPDSVINNIDSPLFMKYAGGQKRSFKARIRLVG
ncbi:MAG: carboxypeptidase regulatory-like domain-containing protein [Acidobacteriota bacterium]|nr:carboxypeptidase regulatory-like domain-containing protein [Acidobacteriota bacterium]